MERFLAWSWDAICFNRDPLLLGHLFSLAAVDPLCSVLSGTVSPSRVSCFPPPTHPMWNVPHPFFFCMLTPVPWVTGNISPPKHCVGQETSDNEMQRQQDVPRSWRAGWMGVSGKNSLHGILQPIHSYGGAVRETSWSGSVQSSGFDSTTSLGQLGPVFRDHSRNWKQAGLEVGWGQGSTDRMKHLLLLALIPLTRGKAKSKRSRFGGDAGKISDSGCQLCSWPLQLCL